MPNITLLIAQSLDGYVATEDGSVAWLDDFNNFDNEDYGFNSFYESIDTVIEGNTTYKQFEAKHEGKFHYVFSHKEYFSDNSLKYVEGNVKTFIDGLDQQHQNIFLIGGPNLMSQFLLENLIDSMIICTMPVLLGAGISLFTADEFTKIELKIKLTQSYANGVVKIEYQL